MCGSYSDDSEVNDYDSKEYPTDVEARDESPWLASVQGQTVEQVRDQGVGEVDVILARLADRHGALVR